ncbi:MAG: galactokinase [Thermodesulfobacteriota bacterium]
MPENITRFLEKSPLTASAPCRVDMGGTLDIKTIYLPMGHLSPATFNLAIDLRTEVTLRPHTAGVVKVSSRGFDSVEFPAADAPYDHPLGLMFAIAAHYNAAGLHLDIRSASPPKSALGGSSAAAVALVCALESINSGKKEVSRKEIALTAHAIEEGAARIPCGLQDQLAAVYGGANAWFWRSFDGRSDFRRSIIMDEARCLDFNQCFLVAYCGVQHESSNINGRWMSHFVRAENRALWRKIIHYAGSFIEALSTGQLDEAILSMNRESDLRKQMTPDVFDDMGDRLVLSARETECGARFTGAGGGGCVWALGDPDNISRLKGKWEAILRAREDALLLNTRIDTRGVTAPDGIMLTD